MGRVYISQGKNKQVLSQFLSIIGKFVLKYLHKAVIAGSNKWEVREVD